MKYDYTSQAQVRAAFWQAHPRLPRRWVNGVGGYPIRPQNSQPTDTRCAFVDYVDMLSKNGGISAELADRVTL